MIKFYTQIGTVEIYTKQEFIKEIPTEDLPSRLYNTPYTYFDEDYDDMVGPTPTIKIKNIKYDVGLNLQIKADEFLEKGSIDDAACAIYELDYWAGDLKCVLIDDIIYMYSDPVRIMFDNKWQIIDKRLDKIFSVSFENSGLKGHVKRVKSTELSRFMYPNPIQDDGEWMYLMEPKC